MSFETRIQQLANGAGLKVTGVNSFLATLLFDSDFRVYRAYIMPFGDVWEFSVQSLFSFDNEDKFPQVILAMLLARNSKSKRGFWCIEALEGKHVLSAMLNVPDVSLTSAEFERICRALVHEVAVIETAIATALR